MGKKFDFQYLVLGGGIAGSATALVLAKAKKKVAIVDEKMTEKAAQKFIDAGITVIFGRGQIKNAHIVAVLEQDFSADILIIATGRALRPDRIEGALEVKCLAASSALRLRKLPKTALVIGGGADGCRAAEYLARGGVKTVLLEKTSRLMPKEEPKVGEIFQDFFKKKLNIMVLTGTEVTQISRDDKNNFAVKFITGKSEHEVKVNLVVLATEKKPAINIGLEKAGIKYNENGIKVNKFLQTNIKNIYAVGGVTGKSESRECANYTGTILGKNLATKSKNLFNYRGFARVIKTFPEVAIIGTSETTLKIKKAKYHKAVVHLKNTEASERTGFDYGFVKILADKQGKILGATIVAPNAEAMIQELVLAMRQGLTISQIAGTPHPLGEFGVAVKMAAKKLAAKK